jgi:lipopolysaccharide/colanic/teichoic acid biosynthesis glycosyltransferase
MYKQFKRLSDITLSLLSIIILTPLLLPIVLGLLFSGEGYVWFFQERVGFKNKKFMIWKFATMLKNSANMKGGYITTLNDSRITPMGGFLRKSKINELPQLINILKGDMSFVGPRPVMKISFDSYPINVQESIYNEKPGLTGIGSIFFRDEEELITNVKNSGGDVTKFYREKIFPFKGKLEMWYQSNKSFLVDLKIIFTTAWVIFSPNSKLHTKIFKGIPNKNF